MLLTSSSIRRRLGNSALDRYECPLRHKLKQRKLNSRYVSVRLHLISSSSSTQHERVPTVQLVGSAGGHSPYCVVSGRLLHVRVDQALHQTGYSQTRDATLLNFVRSSVLKPLSLSLSLSHINLNKHLVITRNVDLFGVLHYFNYT